MDAVTVGAVGAIITITGSVITYVAKTATRFARLETASQYLKELILSKLGDVDHRLERIERGLNGYMKNKE